MICAGERTSFRLWSPLLRCEVSVVSQVAGVTSWQRPSRRRSPFWRGRDRLWCRGEATLPIWHRAVGGGRHRGGDRRSSGSGGAQSGGEGGHSTGGATGSGGATGAAGAVGAGGAVGVGGASGGIRGAPGAGGKARRAALPAARGAAGDGASGSSGGGRRASAGSGGMDVGSGGAGGGSVPPGYPTPTAANRAVCTPSRRPRRRTATKSVPAAATGRLHPVSLRREHLQQYRRRHAAGDR